MPEFDDDAEFDYGSLDESSQQEFLYETIGFFDTVGDQTVHDLFWQVMYNDDLSPWDRNNLSDQLEAYLLDNYGIDFDEIWDWDDFREWYDSQ